jgi:putative spermidine/putrescine transport system ATP-binding protein
VYVGPHRRVGVIRSGRLEQLAAPSDLYAQPTTAFVAEFVGTMNRRRPGCS